ncbi:MAG TPA: RiPP maturation radical SAM C-methyltransferase [Candidatus Angelobacter sp.]|nr:RiPP maturation radical SAM C-methyltransferase [Candidatus Angelobacter sp.]
MHTTPHAASTGKGPRVALVCMPWGSVAKPSLALAILKQCAQRAGYIPHLHFFNIRFAAQIGLQLYERISDLSFVHAEWFFAQLLFGKSGLAELRNNWDDLKASPAAIDLADVLREITGSEALCARIAEEHAPSFIEECATSVDWSSYTAVGFTTTFAQSLSSVLLAKRIKEKSPETKIILGGANVDSEMGVEFLRGFPWIDYVIHGEAEQSFPALLHSIAEGNTSSRTPGVSARQEAQVIRGDHDSVPLADLNDSPAPDYSDYIVALDEAGFRNKINLRLYFESSRGCWWGAKHHCTFCGLNGTSMAFRKKNAERVLSEIEALASAHHCLNLSATDNIFATEYFAQLLPKLAGMDLDLRLFYEVKANLSREQLSLLRDAGVREIQPGIESLNSDLLRLMRKGVTAIQNIQLLKWCYEYEITPLYNILFGFPGETAEAYSELPTMFRLLSHLQPPSTLQQVMFERFSPYHFQKDSFGLTLEPMSLYNFIFPASRVDFEKIAYYFHGKWEAQIDPLDAIHPALESWKTWESRWKERKVFCYYEKGPGFIVIHDNRPRVPNGPIEYRRVSLQAEASAIYLFCDQARSRQAITDMMDARFGAGAGHDSTCLWLDQLVAAGLMYREQERYLALAVRKNPRAAGFISAAQDSRIAIEAR